MTVDKKSTIEAPFHAKDFSEDARLFLYACAFWTVAADETLKSTEQQWLAEQFGEKTSKNLLVEFSQGKRGKFFDVLDDAAESLSSEEKELLYPALLEWLQSCASMGDNVQEANLSIEALKNHLKLSAEIRELAGATTEEVPPGETAKLLSRDDAEDRMVEGHTGEITSLVVYRGGERILSGSSDSTIKLWNYAYGTVVTTLDEHEIGVTSVSVSNDDAMAISVDWGGGIIGWNLTTKEPAWKIQTKKQGGITGVEISPDNAAFITSTNTGLLVIRDTSDGSEICRLSTKRHRSILDVCFSPDGRFVASVGDDEMMRLWDVATGKEIRKFKGHTDGITSVAFGYKGYYIITGSRDNTVRIWEVESGKCVRTFDEHKFSVYDVAFSPDGGYAVSASWDHTMKLWDVQSGENVLDVESATGRFCCVDFLPDGRRIAAGCSDKTIHFVKLW